MSPTTAEPPIGFFSANDMMSVAARFRKYFLLSCAIVRVPTNAIEINAEFARSLSRVATAARRMAASDAGSFFTVEETAIQ
jgi:hypothetical protein